jgi:ABC-type Mn2+/Zn2+ transport system permease subunit
MAAFNGDMGSELIDSGVALPAVNASTAVAVLALALACAALSLVVVWRRWAFLGEGIAHSGFGGAGCAWLLACLAPELDHPGFVLACVSIFCLMTGLGIGVLQRHKRMHSDTAIGVFLVGSLAMGFLAQQVYLSVYRVSPAGYTAILFGHTETLGTHHAQAAAALAVVTVLLLWLLRKEVLACCLDAELASVSGVRERLIHFTLIGLTTLAIIVGVQIVGSVLVTALLILPGATAMLLSRKLSVVTTLALLAGVVGATLGLTAHATWRQVPQGPAVVLSLLLVFGVAYAGSRLTSQGNE